MFIVLVGPPGTGKDQAIAPMRELWTHAGGLNVAPVSMSHKGLIDQLADDSSRKRMTDTITGEIQFYQSLLVAVPELGVILPAHDLGFLSLLNELFTCYDIFEERIRNKGEMTHIDRPHLHLIAGTQPKFMNELFPEAAFGMGFTARVVMVYSGEAVKAELFADRVVHSQLRQDLLTDLRAISKLQGSFSLTTEAAEAIAHWHMEGSEKDKPTHSRLVHYNTRRTLQLLKLCMAMSASRTNDLLIEIGDFAQALDLLLLTEQAMPEIFKEMSSGGQLAHLEEAVSYLLELYLPRKQPVPEHKLVHFLSARVPANQISFMIETMIRSGMVEIHGPNLPERYAQRMFIPKDFVRPE